MAQYLSTNGGQQSLPIVDVSHSAEASRIATRLVGRAGFNETETGRVALIVRELATNILKHAKRGEILMRLLDRGAMTGIELLSLDHGPGIANLTQCFRDGYSTAGSPGTGLGAIGRLADEFDMHTVPGKGTAVLARLWPKNAKPEISREIECGIVSIPKFGEDVCGDGWEYEALADKSVCLVADGLGHGLHAATAARAATAILKEHRTKAPAEIVERAHAAMRSTRGAALAIAEIDHSLGVVRFCGVGNIAGTIVSNSNVRHMVSLNGTAGQEVRKIVEFTYPWDEESTLIMHSDGLLSRWDLQGYPTLAQRHPSLIAAVLYRDYNRNRDDVTVLVARPARSLAQRSAPWLMQ